MHSLFPPGQAPFRVKGVGYRGHLDFVAEHVPGGVTAQNGRFRDPAVADFFEQPFLAGSWYDVYPLVEAGKVCAELRGESLQQLLRVRGRDQMARDLGGVYGFLARFATEGLIARGLIAATERYFDFMQTEVTESTDESTAIDITGIPTDLVDWTQTLIHAYAVAAFEHVGRSTVRVSSERLARGPVRHGRATTGFRIEVAWGA